MLMSASRKTLVTDSQIYRASNSQLFLTVTLCFAILMGSFFLDGAAVRIKHAIRTPELTAAMKIMSNLGSLGILVLVVASAYVIGLGSVRDDARYTAILATLALFVTGFCVLVLKLLTARGEDGEFYFFWAWYPRAMQFPSGHASRFQIARIGQLQSRKALTS